MKYFNPVTTSYCHPELMFAIGGIGEASPNVGFC